MNTLAVVEQVLRQTQKAMSVRDIVEIAGDSLPTRSKTPETVVARDLSVHIKKLGEASRFIRTAPGRFTMREFVATGLIEMGAGAAPVRTIPTNPEQDNPTPVLQQALQGGPSGMIASPTKPMNSVSTERLRELP